MGVKLWHDDVRSAPEGWDWARTNDEAKKILSCGDVEAISLDYDLGNHDLPPDTYDVSPGSGMPGKGSENGVHLIEWMLKHNLMPKRVRVHSWKSYTLVAPLRAAGIEPEVAPFRHGEVIR